MSAPEDHFDVEPMPKDESKPREWWIRECPHMPLKIYNKLSDTQEHNEIQRCCTLFHVVEHRALVEAQAEIKRLNEKIPKNEPATEG